VVAVVVVVAVFLGCVDVVVVAKGVVSGVW